LALGLVLVHDGAVSRARQERAQVDDLLDVNVLVGRAGEDFGVVGDANDVLPVRTWFDGSDCLEQRQDGTPIDVVARGMLKELQERGAVMVTEVFRFWGRRHRSPPFEY